MRKMKSGRAWHDEKKTKDNLVQCCFAGELR